LPVLAEIYAQWACLAEEVCRVSQGKKRKFDPARTIYIMEGDLKRLAAYLRDHQDPTAQEAMRDLQRIRRLYLQILFLMEKQQ